MIPLPPGMEPAYCPNCGIDVLSNPEPERLPVIEEVGIPGLVELRGYCDCGTLSYWTIYTDGRSYTPVLRLAVGNDARTGQDVWVMPPRSRVR